MGRHEIRAAQIGKPPLHIGFVGKKPFMAKRFGLLDRFMD